MHPIKNAIAVALLALAATASQAAHLQLLSGTAGGSSSTSVLAADDDTLSFSGAADDLSSPAELRAFGSATHTGTLPTSGLQFNSAWVRKASLDASGAVTAFSASGASALGFSGTAQLSGLSESAGVGLATELLVAADGEAAGTAVTVRLQAGAHSLFNSSLIGAEDTPTFNLLVQDDAFNTLASYNGLALNTSDTLDISFSSQVGQTLSFALQLDTALSLGNAALDGMQSITSSALLEGTLTVTAVPEPQSVLLLLAGLGLVAAATRRNT